MTQQSKTGSPTIELHSHNTSKGPDIRFTAMTLLVQYFWRQVVRGSTNSFSPVAHGFQFGRQAKVPQLHLHGVIDEQVTLTRKVTLQLDNRQPEIS